MIGRLRRFRGQPPRRGLTLVEPFVIGENEDAGTWVMRRCRRCDVAWAGHAPCWMCGRPGQVPVGAWP